MVYLGLGIEVNNVLDYYKGLEILEREYPYIPDIVDNMMMGLVDACISIIEYILEEARLEAMEYEDPLLQAYRKWMLKRYDESIDLHQPRDRCVGKCIDKKKRRRRR